MTLSNASLPKKTLDIVIAGPDGSGTSTQINWFVDTLSRSYGLRVRDLRGTEVDALWHAHDNPVREEALQTTNFSDFLTKVQSAGIARSISGPIDMRALRADYETFVNLENAEAKFLRWSAQKIRGTPMQEPSLASMAKVAHGTIIDVKDADVWLSEEPPYRLSGLHNRFFEQQRSRFGAPGNQLAAAMAHSLYRESEFYRFRKEILAAEKISLRSRSEESALYQLYDKKLNPTGPKLKDYVKLPGHEIAFKHAPTHIFVAHGPDNWTVADMTAFAEKRMGGRLRDDYEKDADYQLLINKRYATDSLENLYRVGTKLHHGIMPTFIRFDMTKPKNLLQIEMTRALNKILNDAGYTLK